MIVRSGVVGLVAFIFATTTPQAQAAPAETTAVIHARLLTVARGTIEDGTLVMQGGSIIAVGGPATKIPSGARIVNASGATVYPGLFDTGTTIGLTEPETSSVRRPTEAKPGTPVPWASVASSIRVTDQIGVERYNGITNALVSPGSDGPLPGKAALIDLSGDKSRMILDDDAGLWINFAGRRDVYPTTVFGIVGYVRQLLTRARELDAGAKAEDDDAAARSFLPYLEGKGSIIAKVRNDTEAGAALDLAEEFGLKMVLVGLTDVDTEIDRIAKSGFPVVVGALLEDPQTGRRYDHVLRLPARMTAKGIPVSIGSLDSLPGGPRNLPYQAGAAVGFGLDREAALRAITLEPARAFGVADRYGSLEVGKAANVVIADGDPLEVGTDVLQVFIEGRLADMSNRQTRLRDTYSN